MKGFSIAFLVIETWREKPNLQISLTKEKERRET